MAAVQRIRCKNQQKTSWNCQ